MVSPLYHRHILLIISGGIAAYKSLDLIRRLRENGATVRCVLTEGGAQFVTPLSVSALSEHPVYTELFSLKDESEMGHIKLSREADLILVVPATANLIAKMANGITDDLASAVLRASNRPVMIAPAMNVKMWEEGATQANIAKLVERGVTIIGPVSGLMACNETGEGRMADIADITAVVTAHFAKPGPLNGKTALVTAGPTFEPIDPVRYIGNRSSGKQGYAIAEALRDFGAGVTLVSGPSQLPDPVGLKTVRVQTAREMLAACEAALPADIAVCAAAVADWRPAHEAAEKWKKSSGAPVLQLMENPDILHTLAHAGNRRPTLVIGFAAETQNLQQNATEKFTRKGCDWLVANEVGNGKVFGEDNNQVTLFRRDTSGKISTLAWPNQSKENVARQLAEDIVVYFKTA